MIVRRAIAADARAVRACVRAAFARYIPVMWREPVPMGADYPGLIAQGAVQVAEAAGTVGGVLVCYRQGSRMHLETAAVHPDHAGKGIGRALIALCEDRARADGLDSVTLYANEKMTENLRPYPRLGYVETDRRSQDGFARVFFAKRL